MMTEDQETTKAAQPQEKVITKQPSQANTTPNRMQESTKKHTEHP